MSYYPDLAVPGARETIAAFAEQAVAGGTRRLVLAVRARRGGGPAAEQVVQSSGAEWTVVRCSWFMQNFSESYFAEPLAAGELALPAGSLPDPFVHADDIADVAVAASPRTGMRASCTS